MKKLRDVEASIIQIRISMLNEEQILLQEELALSSTRKLTADQEALLVTSNYGQTERVQ